MARPGASRTPTTSSPRIFAGATARRAFRKAAGSLGYHPFPMPAANASRAHRNIDGMTLGACQYCGHCERFMCEAKAKSSAATLLFPLVAGKKNFEMRPNSEVLRLVYDK